MEFEPMLTPRENPLYRKIFPVEDRTRDAVDSEPKHYQRAIPAPIPMFKCPCHTVQQLFLTMAFASM